MTPSMQTEMELQLPFNYNVDDTSALEREQYAKELFTANIHLQKLLHGREFVDAEGPARAASSDQVTRITQAWRPSELQTVAFLSQGCFTVLMYMGDDVNGYRPFCRMEVPPEISTSLRQRRRDAGPFPDVRRHREELQRALFSREFSSTLLDSPDITPMLRALAQREGETVKEFTGERYYAGLPNPYLLWGDYAAYLLKALSLDQHIQLIPLTMNILEERDADTDISELKSTGRYGETVASYIRAGDAARNRVNFEGDRSGFEGAISGFTALSPHSSIIASLDAAELDIARDPFVELNASRWMPTPTQLAAQPLKLAPVLDRRDHAGNDIYEVHGTVDDSTTYFSARVRLMEPCSPGRDVVFGSDIPRGLYTPAARKLSVSSLVLALRAIQPDALVRVNIVDLVGWAKGVVRLPHMTHATGPMTVRLNKSLARTFALHAPMAALKAKKKPLYVYSGPGAQELELLQQELTNLVDRVVVATRDAVQAEGISDLTCTPLGTPSRGSDGQVEYSVMLQLPGRKGAIRLKVGYSNRLYLLTDYGEAHSQSSFCTYNSSCYRVVDFGDGTNPPIPKALEALRAHGDDEVASAGILARALHAVTERFSLEGKLSELGDEAWWPSSGHFHASYLIELLTDLERSIH